MELFIILFLFIGGWIFFKLLGVFFHVGITVLSIPFIVIGTILTVILGAFFIIQAGIIAGLAGILVIPLAILSPLLPVLLIVAGIIWLLRRV